MLIDPRDSGLLVVDLQQRLAPAIHETAAVTRRCGILIEAALRLGLPLMISEQNPQGLGPTLPEIAALAPPDAIRAKMAFSCFGEPDLRALFESWQRRQILVCGTEAHVCVLQSVLDLRAAGYDVFVVADAVGSRVPENRERGLARMARAGAEVVTTEMVVFEWLRRADDPNFRELLGLIK